MKNPLFFFILMIVFSLCVVSCSDSSVEKTSSEEFSTLRAETESLSSKIKWTDEIEQGRLSGKVKTEGLGSKVKASVLSVSAKKNADLEFIYPSIPGFGSLDITLLPLNLKAKIEEFCDSFSKNADLSSLVRKESAYNLALFYYDLASNFPEYDEFFKVEPQPAETEASTQKNVEEKYFFDSFKIGEPFIDGVNYSVPLRLSSKDKILTLETYWTLENSQWMMDQIQISSIENSNDGSETESGK